MNRVVACLAMAFSLCGCCFDLVSGGTGGVSTTGQVGGSSGKAGTSGTTGGTGTGTGARSSGTGRTASGTSSGGGSSTGGNLSSTGGASTGSSLPTLAPTLMLQPATGSVFGPVAITSTLAPHTFGAAKLVYSSGNWQQFGVTLQALSGDGGPLGGPLLIADTSFGLASPAPRVTVANDGNQDNVCWEDYGLAVSTYYSSDDTDDQFCAHPQLPVGQLVRCSSFSDPADIAALTFTECGTIPSLVYNPENDSTWFFFSSGVDNLADWSSAVDAGCENQLGSAVDVAGLPISTETEGVLLVSGPGGWGFGGPPTPGLSLMLLPVNPSETCGGAGQPELVTVDSTFLSSGEFAGASQPAAPNLVTIAAVELDALGLRGVAWELDAGSAVVTSIPSNEPVSGPVAAGTCAQGFGYVAMTDGGALLFAEQSLDGTLLPGAGTLFSLEGFNSTVTSMAVAPAPDGDLFVAVSSSSQLGVYVVACQ